MIFFKNLFVLFTYQESDVTMEVFGESNECASCLYSSFLSDCRSLFFNRINYDKVYFKNLEHFQQSDLINESHLSTKKELDADKMEVDVTGSQSSRGSVKSDVVNNNDLKHEALENDSAIKLVCWNRSDICAEMLKQIFYFRSFEVIIKVYLKRCFYYIVIIVVLFLGKIII